MINKNMKILESFSSRIKKSIIKEADEPKEENEIPAEDIFSNKPAPFPKEYRDLVHGEGKYAELKSKHSPDWHTLSLFDDDDDSSGRGINSNFWKNVGEIEEVDVDDIIPTQLVIYKSALNKDNKSLPKAIVKNGKAYLVDGHHRTASKILKGDKKIEILCFDLEKILNDK